MFNNARPRGGRRQAHWDFVRLESGQVWHGWCAGPPICAWMHQRPAGSPCRKQATGGQLDCQCCRDKIPAVWRAFVPLWDDNGGRWYSVIGERYAELIEGFTFCCHVRVTKMRERGSPVRVERSHKPPAALPHPISTRQPADFRPYLVTLWKDRELAEWFKDNPPDVDEVEAILNQWRDGMKYRQGVAGCVTTAGPAAAAAAAPAGGQRGLPELVGEVVTRLPALNGHGKKGGGR